MPSDLPTVALMPCLSLGGAETEALIAHALVEDLCTELGRFSALRVIAAASSAAVGHLPDREAATQLGATHLLRSTLRRGRTHLRVTATLVDVRTSTQLWAERFDVEPDEWFTLQDEIAARCASALAVRLESATLAGTRGKPTEDQAAYELWLRGRALLRDSTPESDATARELFERAIERDPRFARAYAGVSLTYFNDASCLYWSSFRQNGQRAYEFAHRGLELDESDALLHIIVGRVLIYDREFERASWYFDRAHVLNPNDAECLAHQALNQPYLGHHERALEFAASALALHPLHPNHYWAFVFYAYFFARDFEAAVAAGQRVQGLPMADFPALRAIAHAMLGDMDTARKLLANFERLYAERIAAYEGAAAADMAKWLLDVNPTRLDSDREFIEQGMARIGLRASNPDATRPLTPAAAASIAPLSRAAADEARFVCTDGVCTVHYAGAQATVPELKGLRDLAALLARPGDEVHCLDLAGRNERDAGEAMLDDTARNACQARIRELQEALGEAEDNNDIGRTEVLRDELDSLIESLSNALGLGGRSRRMGDLAERARSTVTWRIRHAIKRVEAAQPDIGRHLRNAVRTGVFCCYAPESLVRWDVKL